MKLTNSDTSTATATVTPNWKKKRPIDAAHEGDRHEHGDDRERRRHDGEADLVGALARRGRVVLAHRDRWRTMFSRTTIASSIRRPMHSDSAISVRKLSVKPNA